MNPGARIEAKLAFQLAEQTNELSYCQIFTATEMARSSDPVFPRDPIALILRYLAEWRHCYCGPTMWVPTSDQITSAQIQQTQQHLRSSFVWHSYSCVASETCEEMCDLSVEDGKFTEKANTHRFEVRHGAVGNKENEEAHHAA